MRFILLTVLLDMVSIGIIIPVLPALVGSFTADRAEQAFWYGAVAFSFGIANFFGSPVLGALSDRYGRRPVLLIGFCGLAFSFFATALATQLWMLIAIRLISGALLANVSVANAYVADITPPEGRASRFGQLGAMFGIGFILGPVMGGLLGAINIHLPFFVAGALALVNLLYGYFVLPESLPLDQRREIDWRTVNPVTSLLKLSQLKGIGGLVAVIGLCNLAQFTLHTSWVLYTTYRFGWGPLENGWSLFAVGLSAAVVQGFLMKRFLKWFGSPRLAVIGLISSTIAHLLWGFSTQGWMMFAVIALNFFGPAVGSTISGMVSSAADAKTQGQTMGSVSSLTSLTAAIAPIIGAPLLGLVSNLPANDWRMGAPFFFCSALLLAATLLALRHFNRQSRQTGELAAGTVTR